jgi:hypothetical protein
MPVISAALEVEVGRISVQSKPGKKVRPHQPISWSWPHMPFIPTVEGINRRVTVQVGLSKSRRPYPKNN